MFHSTTLPEGILLILKKLKFDWSRTVKARSATSPIRDKPNPRQNILWTLNAKKDINHTFYSYTRSAYCKKTYYIYFRSCHPERNRHTTYIFKGQALFIAFVTLKRAAGSMRQGICRVDFFVF